MSKFASGKNAYAISDRSGFRYRYRDMRKEWTGALVGRDEFETKQPQLGPFTKVIDPQALRDARPDSDDPTGAFLVVTTNGIIYLGNGNWSTQGTAELPTEIPLTPSLEGSVGRVTIITEGTGVTGSAGIGQVGSVTINPSTTAPSFDSTSTTLDSTADTFDEG